MTALLTLLKDIVGSDGGTSYQSDEDTIGTRACCHVLSWKPHLPDCYVARAKAMLGATPEPRGARYLLVRRPAASAYPFIIDVLIGERWAANSGVRSIAEAEGVCAGILAKTPSARVRIRDCRNT